MANELDHVISDGCSSAICPYCDEPIVDGQTEKYGGLLLHAACYVKLGEDFTLLHAECVKLSEDLSREPIEVPSEDELDYAYGRYYGF